VGEKVVPAGSSHLKVGTELCKLPLRESFAEAAKYAAAKINLLALCIDGILGASIGTAFYQCGITVFVHLGQAAESLIELNGLFGVFGCSIPLL